MKESKRERESLAGEGALEAGNPVLPDRRSFLETSGHGFGALALGSLLFDEEGRAATVVPENPRVRRVISLFMSGGPSQMDLLDPKPGLEKERGRELASTFERGQYVEADIPSPSHTCR